MPRTPCKLVINPQVPVTVSITTAGGVVVTAYTTENGSSTHTLPLAIATQTTFWLTTPGSYTVSALYRGTEIAGKAGTTTTVDVSSDGVGFLQVGIDRPAEDAAEAGTSVSIVAFLQALLGFDYGGRVLWATAGSASSIQTQITAAVAGGASISSRWLVIVPAGTYDSSAARINGATGVDVVGQTGNQADVIITSSGASDAMSIGGCDCVWAFLTITHTGSNVAYAIHADSGGLTGLEQMVLVDVVMSSESKSAIGIGLNPVTAGGQGIWLINCDATALGLYGGNKSAIFAHDHATLHASTFVAINTRATATVANGIAFNWQSQGSTVANNIYWVGGLMSGTLLDFAAYDITGAAPSVATNFFIDPRALPRFTNVALPSSPDLVDIAGQTIPLPTHCPKPALIAYASAAAIANGAAVSPPAVPSKLKSGNWYTRGTTTTNNAQAQSRLFAVRLHTNRLRTVKDVACYVKTVAASSFVRFGIALPDANGEPGTIVYDSGQIDTSSGTGTKSPVAASLTAPNQLVWGDFFVLCVSQGGAPTLLAMTTADESVGGSTAAGVLVDGGALNAYYQNSVTGALPGTFAATGITSFGTWLAAKLS